MTGNRERVALACFVAGALLAGGNGVSIRFSNRELPPLWGAGLRFSLAAGLLLVVMAVLRLPFPRGRALTGALLYGALNFGAAFALAYYALVRLHAGLGQTLLALVPLATLLLAVAQGQERLRAAAVIGTLLALAGVAVISQGPLRASVPLGSLLAAVASALCIAQAAVLVRRFPAVHPVTMNAVWRRARRYWWPGRCSLASRAHSPHAPPPGPLSAIWSWSARWWCSCCIWWCCGTGPRRGRRMRSCSSRS